MNDNSNILKHSLDLALAVRDSQEGQSWRSAWDSLRELELPKSANFGPGKIPLLNLMAMTRHSEQAQARPMMYCLLLNQPPFGLIPNRVTAELDTRPKLRAVFQQLVSCLGFITLIVAFLRSIAPGYPHSRLIYTLPDTQWSHLSSRKELPWPFGGFLMPTGVNDARNIGLGQFTPSIAKVIAAILNVLVTEIRMTPTFTSLRDADTDIQRRPSLLDEMERAKAQFVSRIGQINRARLPRPIWMDEFDRIAKNIYEKRGPRILAYVTAFQDYERLIENIYWIISQVVMFEVISCISTADAQQVQQVQFDIGSQPYLTAVALSQARTLQVGQLVHISLPETDQIMDGLYHIHSLHFYYAIESGARIFFHGPRLWEYSKNVLDKNDSNARAIFTPSERAPILGEMKLAVAQPNGEYTTIDVRDNVPRLQYTKTVYLP